ncbi:esterase family protein [Micromonospora sp. DR5-3]|uniref:alpha/beta hydrolase n=1 Tax=unclassified Micromonospora TaxID=2617518 RepID=UPI0011D61E81|nr:MULTISPECIES: alpha/beta hydrolase family protein [unclassified Micromonospora]MCW3815108.1 esterase family protein [Micromonospora sp. DR5-3]TYC21988.1 esterase family protein [Micromonospora sp. MP36]
MARIRCDFFSEALGMGTSMTVLLPERAATQIGMAGSVTVGDPPVLYLLHGLSDDDTIWTRRTSIERYVAPLGLAVVMPQAGRSFYTDEAHGNRYWTFLSEELPRVCHSFFRLSDRRADTFVAGLSMGGYGAVKWALREPGRFAAAASLSGALDVSRRRAHPTSPVNPAVWHTVWGDREVTGTDDDTVALLERAGDDLPALYVACGTEDFLYEDNVRFVDTARRRGTPVTVDFSPGDHDWAYWDAKIQDVLAWLPLRRDLTG